MPESPLYVYAFCDAPALTELKGLNDEPVTFVESDGIFAAVSPAPSGRIRPQRRLLAAHQGVLAAIAGEVSTLPAAFGLIADDADLLDASLRTNADTLRRELDRVAGCVEMETRLSWDVPNVFDHLVTLDPELGALRDELAGLGDRAPHELRMRAGRRVEAVLNAYRADAEHRLTDALSSVARELITTPPTGEAELTRVTTLLARDDTGAYETAVEQVATTFDETHAFRLSGPFAPHSFVDLRLDLSRAA